MKKAILWITVALLALAGGAFAWRQAAAAEKRPDCPGKIICPITGEPVCVDQCPLTQAE